MAEEFARPNKEAKFHDLAQFTLYTESGKKGFRAALRFGERNGAPRISVSTQAEQGPRMLGVGLAPEVWQYFVDAFTEIANGPNNTKAKIVNMQKDPNFTDRAVSFDDVPKVPKNTLHFGKNEEGICWVAVEQKDAARLVFKILPSAWHQFYDTSGRLLTPEELSSAYARTLMKSVEHAMHRWTSRLRTPWEPDASKTPKTPDASGAGMYSGGDDFSESLGF